MMLLIVLYDGIVLVWMAWNTDDSVTTICDDDDVVIMSLSVLYAMCCGLCIVRWEPYEW